MEIANIADVEVVMIELKPIEIAQKTVVQQLQYTPIINGFAPQNLHPFLSQVGGTRKKEGLSKTRR
ncbi:hypothetical protein [Acetobacter sp. DmW_125131]|uniref:Uncharacterized protein n=2 Tax=Acetobacter TaxID=434 RepID=A0AAN1PGD3_9PROT|nr:hypothetical protein [Acetobacter sp. DmW_125131]ASL40899.1 hypothetical protein CBI36_11065 [Acetobacter oryzifermentans]AXM99755.1 hypothetical protein CJF59_03740 [Acetobacter pomorum]